MTEKTSAVSMQQKIDRLKRQLKAEKEAHKKRYDDYINSLSECVDLTMKINAIKKILKGDE